MKGHQIRQTFFDFFKSKGHKIVPSAPIVNKDDPTLLFTNAGMNQFKDYFLGNQTPPVLRIADTQKCLRVSGKHNDLEEVGVDSYHHTMFEMLGNWSFGDYFKKDAIAWAWELLSKELGLPQDRLYATIFGGDEAEQLAPDKEATDLWKQWLPEDKILPFGKKDNFWEMGDTGPCGPCSEIHIDLRSDADRAALPAAELINKDHPQVIEIWNLVFIQYNRKQNGSLEELPAKHVDTGMGLERLAMAMQGHLSNYDTDLFTPYLDFIQAETGIKYTNAYAADSKSDMAMRVIADHLRAVCFTIADGALPDNTGPGYVVRRILRRAVRYYYSFLDRKEPLLHKMIPLVADSFAEVFPEVKQQQSLLTSIVLEEEKSFLRTLEAGLRRFDALQAVKVIPGEVAFELYDTHGFPIDLTRLIAREKGLTVDEEGFQEALKEQRDRSRSDAEVEIGDWHEVKAGAESQFLGYDDLELSDVQVVKHRTVRTKGKDQYQLVLDRTPFYAEGGGQIGDTGFLDFDGERIKVLNTIRENELIVHLVDKLPSHMGARARASVSAEKRRRTENNHTATHLLHAALRQVLGDHVQQKGSLVADSHLRFDFSHFKKMTSEEIRQVEQIVNAKIRENIGRDEQRKVALQVAKEAGATMLFGEKYGDEVRMITFDPQYSIELCGGCHVEATGQIGYFKITQETSVAAGIRRIEAITAEAAEAYLNEHLDELDRVRNAFKNPLQVADQVSQLVSENKTLQKQVEQLKALEIKALKDSLKDKIERVGAINYLAIRIDNQDSKALKSLAYQLEKEVGDAFIVFGSATNNKPQLMVTISDGLTKDPGLHAGNIVRELAKEIQGGGGGQPFFATAGGKNAAGLSEALSKSRTYLSV